MRDHLILKLQGVMQAWGEHTFEGLRPSANFPTRSALLGLLGACLGIDRTDQARQQALTDSIQYAVRKDSKKLIWNINKDKSKSELKPSNVIKITDYHTVKDAREDYIGLKSHKTIETRREYLLDASFTVAIWNPGKVVFSLNSLQKHVCKPHYTPFLGRRSCPITCPLYQGRIEAVNSYEALKKVLPYTGVIYSEEDMEVAQNVNKQRHRVRDVPIPNQLRQFSSRMVYVYGKEDNNVSE